MSRVFTIALVNVVIELHIDTRNGTIGDKLTRMHVLSTIKMDWRVVTPPLNINSAKTYFNNCAQSQAFAN